MPYKVYLADDSITIQKVVELTLSEEDFEVTAFGDGESALDAARKVAPDIVLADIVMPRMDGYQLSQAIKQDPALKNIPVLLLAGTFENFDAGLAEASLADGHIIKPFESSDLINKVRELVERKARTAPEPPESIGENAPMDERVQPAGNLPFEEPAEEILDAEPVDDLWSVVDLQSGDQPLAGASEVMSYFTAPSPQAGEGLPWDELPMDAVMEEDEEPMEALLADEDDDVFLAREAPEETLEAVEAEDVMEAVEADEVLEAVEAEEAEPPEPPAPDVSDFMQMPSFAPIGAEAEEEPFAAPFAVPSAPPTPAAAPAAGLAAEPDELHKLVEAKVREVISGMSRETAEKVVWEVLPGVAEKVAWDVLPGVAEKIVWEVVPGVVEKIVWEVVPALAEQIIVKEIEKLKAES
jgi:CheY-like chemotaxis protein